MADVSSEMVNWVRIGRLKKRSGGMSGMTGKVGKVGAVVVAVVVPKARCFFLGRTSSAGDSLAFGLVGSVV